MRRRTKLEVYAYTVYGSVRSFSQAMGLSNVAVWKWIHGRARPSKRNALRVYEKTDGYLTQDYLRNDLK